LVAMVTMIFFLLDIEEVRMVAIMPCPLLACTIPVPIMLMKRLLGIYLEFGNFHFLFSATN
jgi:hypothetical protein